ncbi:hypothetical protein [Marinoscillum sp.]|uniref:hypothetical protein n=1 Tax=Marinoscillum sp. TaxID=2024838 RepID=UPI003BAD6AD5
MKQSKKLLIITGGTLVVLFLVAIVLLKQEAKEVVARYAANSDYERLETGEFHSMVVGPGFDVLVVGWLERSVSMETNHPAKPTMTNVDGILHFNVTDTTIMDDLVGLTVRVQDIKSITSVGNTALQIADVETDSLSVKLKDMKLLELNSNKISHMKLETAEGLTIVSTQKEDGM